jgi:hypothetical protein
MRIVIVVLLLGIGGAVVVHERKVAAELVRENARHRTEAEQLSLRIRELEREIALGEAQITNAQKRIVETESATAVAESATNHVEAKSADTLKRELQREDFYLHKRHLANIGVSALTRDLVITEEIAALLAMTPDERGVAQEKIDGFAATLHELELANLRPTNQPPASVAKREGTKYAYYLPPMVDEGQRLKDELMASLQQTIGAQRTELLTSKVDWDHQFNQLGKVETFITFIDVPQPDGSYQRYVSIKHPHDEATYRFAGELQKSLQHLFRVEPAEQ